MSGSFGSFFDVAVNRFGIDFVATENNVFGIDPFAPPSTQVLGFYDFNNYTANSPLITDETNDNDAVIHSPDLNTFDETDPANKFLTIYAPDIFPSETGGITTPPISGVQTIELWVRMDIEANYGTYFIDFRGGLDNGFMIGGTSGAGTVGTDWIGQTIYYNTVPRTITATTNPVADLYTQGWTQVVLVRTPSYTDDMSLFCRFSQQQGCPISVAQIIIYDGLLTQTEIVGSYNFYRSRYGLPSV